MERIEQDRRDGGAMTAVTIQVTIEQARAMCRALDTYSRLCIGQFEALAQLCRDGTIPIGGVAVSEPRQVESVEGCELIDRRLRECKQIAGYSPNGSNGIGHPHVHVSGHRTWELKKQIERALAMHHEPNPSFPSVDYDGRIVRYTGDPDAIVRVEE